ncbi:hypothetical protein [Mycolicibacterium celeriflavum]|uniref:hypothetical protein n=1 Tax=Mycolicibacterium celeriflavum TaxID=1249101 RepID=UPI001F3ABDB6|nr:hypothetical protein [Mycolicibacterium celeriflavum]
MVPDSEFSAPILTVGPEVSTHDAALAESDSVALLPQPDSSNAIAATTPPALKAERFNEERRTSRMDSLSREQQRSSPTSVDSQAARETPRGVELGR